MQLIINGEARQFDSPLTVAEILPLLSLSVDKIAIEHNLEIVPKSAYHTHMLGDGDRLEIVHFIGGG